MLWDGAVNSPFLRLFLVRRIDAGLMSGCRYFAGMSRSADGRIFVYGGCSTTGALFPSLDCSQKVKCALSRDHFCAQRAGRLGDLIQLNPATLEWTVFASNVVFGTPPAVRCSPGFAAGPNATLFVFGGIGNNGTFRSGLRGRATGSKEGATGRARSALSAPCRRRRAHHTQDPRR